MPRGISAALITELAKDSFNLCNLIFIDVGSGLYLTDYFHDITYDGNDYLASDHLIGVGSPRESRDLRVNNLTVQVSGVEQSYISLFLQNDFVNKQAIIRKAGIDDDGSIIGDPMITFNGRVTRFEIRESKSTSEVSIEIASHWADFDKKGGRLTNNNSQQFFFDGDIGFEYAANTVRDLKWGRK